MDVSRRIAAVLGPTLLAVTMSEAINLRIWAGVDATVVYLNGLVFLIDGLVIVTTHNNWNLDFRVLVTVSGWLLVIAGAYRIFFPMAPQLAPGVGTYLVIAALFSLGVAISLYAFFLRAN